MADASILYNTAAGRTVLKVLSRKKISAAAGRFMDSGSSRILIPRFVRKNGIDLSEYVPARYTSFNSFFTREIRPELRPVSKDPADLVCPCDGLLSAYRLSGDDVIPVKQSAYTLPQLLGGDPVAERYRDGVCLVFRLCVNNYHRYCFMDSGTAEKSVCIPGILHSVQPVALARYPVFLQNSREYTLLHTDNFGDVLQMEVGALLVGKIDNYGKSSFARGEEKGMFLYGGSTVILLLEKGRADIPDELFDSTSNGTETPVIMGEVIGKKRAEP